ncbi:MAG: acyltransferase family protein [Xanthomonadales bacterium]|nr:acyltransferase family protein [Xanthomonadales bacterium]
MNTKQYEFNGRRYDLDWLRVLAFGILILYHTGMFYVADWGWHIKSDVTSETLQLFMRLVNPWRMPLLFLVSGAALWFAAKKTSASGLLKLRLARLLPPLVFGMLVIIPPQIYHQIMQYEGAVFSNYLQFYAIYLDPGTELFPAHQSPIGLLSWTHLWFIPYLLIYTLAFVITKPLLDRLAAFLSRNNAGLFWLYVVPLALIIPYVIYLRPFYPQSFAVVGDWYCHALFFTMFVFGYVMAGHLRAVNTLIRQRWVCLTISSLSYLLCMLSEFGPLSLPLSAVVLINCLNGWSWILTVLAWSAAHLNRPSRVLTYMNTAILPWYVLHQTITIILAWHLSSLGLPISLEATLVVFGTVGGCAVGYEVIRRFRLTRFLFGLKLQEPKRAPAPDMLAGELERC